MRFAYTVLMYLITPFILLRLWWKGRRLPAYRARISERFYMGKRFSKPVDIWVHAASLGEVIAVAPLVYAFLDKGWSVLITTMTPTGSAQVKKLFLDKVGHQYIPYDLPMVLKRFFRTVKPRVGIIMETELWPNMIYEAKAAQVVLMLANARLSESSLQGYLKCKWFFKPIINQFSAILAQSEDDADRFMRLGATKEKVCVLGNMKFDVQVNKALARGFSELKTLWGESRVVVIAASTHDDEESQLLSQLPRLQQAIPNLILLIAPRHPERFKTVYRLSEQAGFKTGLRSNKDSLSAQTQVVILDSLGELMGFYELSDYAFVGGSLVPVGGHNVLEPIALRVPVLTGTQVHNFKSICSDLEEAKAIQLVQSVEQLIDKIILLHQNDELQRQMLENASLVLDKNKGAVAKYLHQVEEAL